MLALCGCQLAGCQLVFVDPSTVPLYTVSANSGATRGIQGKYDMFRF